MTLEMDTYRTILRAMYPTLKEKYSITDLGLFGSRVRGDNRPESDLDILVSFDPDAYVSLFTLVELEDLLTEALQVKVDLSYKVSLKPCLRSQILAEVESV